MNEFKWARISLEQYKQMCRFQKEPYYPGDYEKYLIQQGIVQWKIYNKRAMDKRDDELKKISSKGELLKRYPMIFIMHRW
jgi:hypothetical protein